MARLAPNECRRDLERLSEVCRRRLCTRVELGEVGLDLSFLEVDGCCGALGDRLCAKDSVFTRRSFSLFLIGAVRSEGSSRGLFGALLI